MSNIASDKYTAFRNFMCNELGITRQDIEAWTKQSVANEVEKRIGQINVEKLVNESILKATRDAMTGYSTNGIREALAKELANQLVLQVKAK
jgi:hypothetical protein